MDERCPFLDLPREMRNEIYRHTTKSSVISRPDQDTPPSEDTPPTEDVSPSDDTPSSDNPPQASTNGDTRLLSTPGLGPMVQVHNAASRDLLCVNRQVHDEYLEFTQPRHELFIFAKSNGDSLSRALEFQVAVPSDVLAKVQDVLVIVHWANIFTLGTAQQRGEFWSHVRDGHEEPHTLPWTPSKGQFTLRY